MFDQSTALQNQKSRGFTFEQRSIGMKSMYELNDTELDLVAGGHPLLQAGLINANVEVSDIDVLNNNQVTLTNVLSGNDVQVAAGIAVAVLSGATGVGLLNKMP
jgi:hypothetical protein